MIGHFLPDWVVDEIKSVRGEELTTRCVQGRVLKVHAGHSRVEVQFSEAVGGGAYTATLEAPRGTGDMRGGRTYSITFEQIRTALSRSVAEFFREEGLEMDAVYRFRLRRAVRVYDGTYPSAP